MRRVALPLIALAFLPFICNQAVANYIPFPQNAQLTLYADDADVGGYAAYNAATQIFSFIVPFGRSTVPNSGAALQFPPFNTFTITDILGQYNLFAKIDSNGNVLGGAFWWVAESPTLGINSPEVFLAGAIPGSTDGLGGGPPLLYARLDYVNPAIASLTTAPKFAILILNSLGPGICLYPCVPSQSADPKIWQQDETFNIIEPDIFAYRVPEPPTWELLAGGVLAVGFSVGWPRRRRMRTFTSMFASRITRTFVDSIGCGLG